MRRAAMLIYIKPVNNRARSRHTPRTGMIPAYIGINSVNGGSAGARSGYDVKEKRRHRRQKQHVSAPPPLTRQVRQSLRVMTLNFAQSKSSPPSTSRDGINRQFLPPATMSRLSRGL